MIEAATPVWPPTPVVLGMLRGWRGIYRTSAGQAYAGIRSIHPWIYYAEGNGAICERCVTKEPAPDPPTSRGLNGKGEPLFGIQTTDYALFLLAWLHAFAGRHSICQPGPAVAAA